MGKFLDILLKRNQAHIDSLDDGNLPSYNDSEINEELPIIDYPSLISPERTNQHTTDALDLMMAGLHHDLNEDRQTNFVGGVDPVDNEPRELIFTGYTGFSGSTVFMPWSGRSEEETPKEEKVTFLNKKK